ncbi:GNAT family N-acetyltransferase [Leifsonia sp. NPDC058194]|uniref:GNAT family N-acetyltransferase n=1 Tax=Leifsonia sp. NPDC058194 TaxID=3346374 RepID=UPI0036D9F67F
MLTLRTPRLVLDAPRESDIDAVLAACQDEQTLRWVPLPNPYTRASAEFFVRSYGPHGLASGQYTVWAMRPGEHEPLIGAVEVRRDESAGSASLGCWLAPESRGHGMMHEALVAVTAHALAPDGLGFSRLRWEYLPGNEQSRHLAEAVGFDFAGAVAHRIRFHDEERDALVGVLLRGDGAADG